jgi:hypothetical protein
VGKLRDPMSEMTAAPTTIATFAGAARDYVRRVLGVELDGSTESLAFVDHYIKKTREAGALTAEVMQLAAGALGAYFGEVARARFGGRWAQAGEDPTEWTLELEPVVLRFNPAGMAAEALQGGELDGWDGSFSTKQSMMEPLAEALAAVAPVEESYYYSLTGRLETLEHAVDVLLTLEQRAKDKGRGKS